jgi:hypothetical protein
MIGRGIITKTKTTVLSIPFSLALGKELLLGWLPIGGGEVQQNEDI